MWKVVMIDQLGREYVPFRGEADACEKWMFDNEDDYPGCDFYVEPVTCANGKCE